MFEVGQFIVHPGQGVCRVEGVESEPYKVYKLMPLHDRHAMVIRFPIASESRLRSVCSAEEALELIEAYPSMDVDTYTDRSGALEEEHFKNEIKHGTCADTVRIVKTFRQRIQDVSDQNKRPPVAYERILKEAQTRSLSELAVALDTTPEDIEERFKAANN